MIRPLDRQAFREGKPNTRWNAPVTALCDAAQMGLNSGQVKATALFLRCPCLAQLFQRSTVSLIGLTKARPSARLFSHSRFSC